MASFEVTLTSKGQITIPAELRAKLNLKEGDKLEFYMDRSGRVLVRFARLRVDTGLTTPRGVPRGQVRSRRAAHPVRGTAIAS